MNKRWLTPNQILQPGDVHAHPPLVHQPKANCLVPSKSLILLFKESNPLDLLKNALNVEEEVKADKRDEIEEVESAMLNEMYKTESETSDEEGDNWPFCQNILKIHMMEEEDEES